MTDRAWEVFYSTPLDELEDALRCLNDDEFWMEIQEHQAGHRRKTKTLQERAAQEAAANNDIGVWHTYRVEWDAANDNMDRLSRVGWIYDYLSTLLVIWERCGKDMVLTKLSYSV